MPTALANFWRPPPIPPTCKFSLYGPLSTMLTNRTFLTGISDAYQTDLARAGLVETTFPPTVPTTCLGRTLYFRRLPRSRLGIQEGIPCRPTALQKSIALRVTQFLSPPAALQQWTTPHVAWLPSPQSIHKQIVQSPMSYPRRSPPAQPYLRPPQP